MALSMMHLFLLVPVVAFQHESALESAVRDHNAQHTQQCQSLDLTLPSYSNYDEDEHDCDVSSLTMDTVAADEVMDMNELTCQMFCGKVNHGDCQCDEEECDKNDVGKDGTVRDGSKCVDANSAHDVDPDAESKRKPCTTDYECTMNGPMSFCTQLTKAAETIDVAICPKSKGPEGATTCDKLDGGDDSLSTHDTTEGDCDVKSGATDLSRADAAMDLKKADAALFCGTNTEGNFQCNEKACDGLDEPSEAICKFIDGAPNPKCKKDFECTTLGALSYCTEVDQVSRAPTVDVAICGFV